MTSNIWSPVDSTYANAFPGGSSLGQTGQTGALRQGGSDDHLGRMLRQYKQAKDELVRLGYGEYLGKD